MIEIKYTKCEGGNWNPMKVPGNSRELIYELQTNRKTSHIGKRIFWFSRIGRTLIHSVKFQNSKVWDSTFNDFRKKNFVGSKPTETQNGR